MDLAVAAAAGLPLMMRQAPAATADSAPPALSTPSPATSCTHYDAVTTLKR